MASGWPDVGKTCSSLFATREENDVTSVEEGVLPSTGRREDVILKALEITTTSRVH